MKYSIVALLILICGVGAAAGTDFRPVDELNTVSSLKAEILKMAMAFEGQGDPDRQIQDTFEPYVDKLVALSPQVPVSERLGLLAGAWRQVWGPYEFRKNDGSVPSNIDVTKFYQVVFEDGYYYNISNNYKEGTTETDNTGILRGEFDVISDTTLKVQFTNLCKIDGPPPERLDYVALPALVEADQLEGVKTVLPSWLVKIFLGGGTLKEVYTDSILRLAYGTGKDADARPRLFILRRVD